MLQGGSFPPWNIVFKKQNPTTVGKINKTGKKMTENITETNISATDNYAVRFDNIGKSNISLKNKLVESKDLTSTSL